MKVSELQANLTEHAEDGRRADDEVLVRIGREYRKVTTSYSDGTFILVAGSPVVN
jgi:hypothetical protein